MSDASADATAGGGPDTPDADAALDAVAERLRADIARGDHFPDWLAGRLDLERALGVQVRLLRYHEAAGEQLSGWKVGLTSARARAALGSDARPFGYLLASHTFTSGAVIEAAGIRHPTIEPEFLFTIGERIAGPDVTPDQVRSCVASVAAGYELNERRAGSLRPDLVLMAADRMTQWGVVEGDGVPVAQLTADLGRASPGSASLGDVAVRVTEDGEDRLAVRGGDEVDDHWTSIARLVRGLHRHGLALEAGQKVITGGLGRFEMVAGRRWRAEFQIVPERPSAVEVQVT